MERLLTTLLLLLSPAAAAFGQPATDAWSIKDVLNQKGLRSVSIAPEGERVLWVKTTPDFEKDHTISDLHLTYLDDPHGAEEPQTVRLTRTGDNRSPAWSPGGESIAFVSERSVPGAESGEEAGSGNAQVWLQDPRGGAPRPLTRSKNGFENGVEEFAWLSDERLAVVAREKTTRYEEQNAETDGDARVVEDTTEFYPRRLFAVEAETGEVERLTTGDGHVEDFAAAPSGRYLVYSVRFSPITADARNQPQQYLLDLRTGEREEIFSKQYVDPSNFKWTLSGDGFYATDSRASDPEHEGAGITELHYFDADAREHEKVPLGWDKGLGYGGYAITEGGVHVQLANGPRMKPRFLRKDDGMTWTRAPVDERRLRHSTSVDVGPGGETIVFDYSRPDSIPRYYVARYRRGQVSGGEELVELNGYLQDKPMPKAEVVRWEGARNDTVNGILYYPLDYDPDRRYPLVTVIHGGPSGVDLDAWRLGWTVFAPLWAQRGAFVFRPNYHGSSNHGLEFVESIKGRYYELEIPDIVKGIDRLAAEGKVDRDSLGVMGWSNGAILTNQLTIEHPEMFEAAAPGAGDVNWISDYGNCSFGVRFDNSYFGGAPWNNIETYIDKSPLFEMDKVRAPTLIQFGDSDKTVPTEQGWQHYRALQQIGKAPVRFILYPDEGHGLGRLSHQRRKMEEDLAWMDTYLFGETSMTERVADRRLPDDAPLARLERTKAIARTDGGRYGERVGGVLAPETVPFGDTLSAGRFEVTRAQWQAFDDDYDAPPGTENYPVTGRSFAEAQDYVAWLREQTGRPYRLLTKNEHRALAESASGDDENDLSYWTDYAPTPGEREALKARLSTVAPDRLLMPVGSRPPGYADREGAPLVFDLGGNAAEWTLQDDGSGGTVTGASTVTFADEKAATPLDTPPPAFTGLRVAVE
jgi:dipeptidyl aminopeptidase/acylaminoacyl peptidase